MSRHIAQNHTDNADRKYKCTLCGKGFIESKGLREHMNTHTGAKPYMCTFCGAAFASHGTWRMHERTVHLGHKRDESAHVKAAQLSKSLHFAFKDEKK